MPKEKKIVGVVGAGSFGTTVASLLAHNVDVLIFSRQQEVVDRINTVHENLGYRLDPRIHATKSLEEICERASLIFPVVPSENFRETCVSMSPYLSPAHVLIHATKGLDLAGIKVNDIARVNISRKNIHTMSEVIRQETSVLRVGCLAGPNLYREIMANQPAASVIASEYDEVIKAGSDVLSSRFFFVFGSYDLLGAEMAGALKNIIALGSGMLSGKGLGKNLEAMLITRGLREMIELGRCIGSSSKSFLGTAGIGDLIATATSPNSRNFNFGYRLGKGERLKDIISSLDEVVEGVRTVRIANQLAKHYHLRVPIIDMIFSVVFEDFPIEKAIQFLMRYPYLPDVDFL
ncbi:MAG: NAD(P)-dependent glycerol-3-phosphate dehydrogenase [Saprospiraceae bacterium]|nr:NAD(P)-dependent glycerol-3-phosphate dehydrogenase [Saprospiraceae bacterium]